MSGYTRDLVIQLLPAAWDPSFAYGMDNPTTPDPDMPRVAADKSHGNTLYAHIADIKQAWRCAPLTTRERIALVLAYGFGWKQGEIGTYFNVSQKTISVVLDKAVGELTHWLNGTTEEEYTAQ